MNLKFILVVLTIISISNIRVYAQNKDKTSHPNITVVSEKGKEDKRIYHLPEKANYKVVREADNFELIKGEGKEVDISGLVPGAYFIIYKFPEGNGMVDRFTIPWKTESDK